MMRVLVLMIATAVFANAAYASVAWQGTLSNPHFMETGIVLVYTSGNRSGLPTCGAGQPGRYALDGTTPPGKLQVAGLLTAFASGRQVVIVGTGTCSVYPDSETISYFYVAD